MISNKKLFSKKLKNCAVIIGYDLHGVCVYHDFLSLEKYYDNDHVWDDSEQIKMIKLHKIVGYLFDENCKLIQEFNSFFNVNTGEFINGWAKDEDGQIEE